MLLSEQLVVATLATLATLHGSLQGAAKDDGASDVGGKP